MGRNKGTTNDHHVAVPHEHDAPDVVAHGVREVGAAGEPGELVHGADGAFGVRVLFPQTVAYSEAFVVGVRDDVVPVDGEPEFRHKRFP